MVEKSLSGATFSSMPRKGEASLEFAANGFKNDPWRGKKDSWEAALPAGFTSDVVVDGMVKYSLESMNFPRSIQDFKERQRSVPPIDRVISFGDLGVDFGKAFWAAVDLRTKVRSPQFLAKEEHLRGPATVVLGQGLATFYGHDFFKRAAPWARNMMTHGTYNDPMQYLEAMGAEVIVAKTDPLINRGNIKRNEMAIKNAVERVKMASSTPVYLIGHSVDALSAQVFMSKNRQIARELDGIMLVAGPLPDRVNPWVGDVFLASGDKTDNFEYVEPVIDLYRSGDAKRMNIVSIKDSPDRVLDGWAGGAVVGVDLDGHSSILHQHRNLRGLIHYMNQNSYPVAA